MTDLAIVIPTHDRANVVGHAVRSALEQVPSPDEVLVVDDGSTDSTTDVLAGFSDRIRTHHQPNAGVSAARNAGIDRTCSAIVGFLDSDDVLLEGVVRSGLDEIERGADAVLFSAYCGMTGEHLTKPLRGDDYRLSGLLGPDEAWALPCGLFRRSLLDAVGGFDDTLTCGEDYLLLLCALASGHSVRVLREPGFVKDRRPDPARLSARTVDVMRGKLEALRRFERRHEGVARKHQGRILALRSGYMRRLGRALAAGDPADTGQVSGLLWEAVRQRPTRLGLLFEALCAEATPALYRAHRRHRAARRARHSPPV